MCKVYGESDLTMLKKTTRSPATSTTPSPSLSSSFKSAIRLILRECRRKKNRKSCDDFLGKFILGEEEPKQDKYVYYYY